MKTKSNIIYATKSDSKLALARNFINSANVDMLNADIPEYKSDDIKEITRQKARLSFEKTGIASIAEDSSFMIKALNGFPKANVMSIMQTIGVKGILRLMEGEKDRSCKFSHCVAYYDGANFKFFESESKGNLALKPSNLELDGSWTDLWSIYIVEGFETTLNEFTRLEIEIYEKTRKKSALEMFAAWYDEEVKGKSE